MEEWGLWFSSGFRAWHSVFVMSSLHLGPDEAPCRIRLRLGPLHARCWDGAAGVNQRANQGLAGCGSQSWLRGPRSVRETLHLPGAPSQMERQECKAARLGCSRDLRDPPGPSRGDSSALGLRTVGTIL